MNEADSTGHVGPRRGIGESPFFSRRAAWLRHGRHGRGAFGSADSVRVASLAEQNDRRSAGPMSASSMSSTSLTGAGEKIDHGRAARCAGEKLFRKKRFTFCRRKMACVRVLSPICPHLGCSIPWNEDKAGVYLSVSRSRLRDGWRARFRSGAASMDDLESKVDNGMFKVRYQYFRQLIPTKGSSLLRKATWLTRLIREKSPCKRHGAVRLYQWLDHRTGIGSLMHEALGRTDPWRRALGLRLRFGPALSVYFADDHRSISRALLRAVGRPRAHDRRLHRQGSNRRLVFAQPARLRLERGRHRLAFASDANVSLRRLQRPPRTSLDFRLRASRVDAGDGVHRIFAAVGPESVLRHHRRNQHGLATVPLDWLMAQTFHARRKRDGHADGVAIFCGACFYSSGGRSSRFIASHVYLFRKAGAAGPPSEDPVNPKLPTERFYPQAGGDGYDRRAGDDLILGSLSHFYPTKLGPKSESGRHSIRSAAGMVLPADFPVAEILARSATPSSESSSFQRSPPLLLVCVPFIDRRLERRPWRRPICGWHFRSDSCRFRRHGIHERTRRSARSEHCKASRQAAEDTEQFMRAPFEPEGAATSLSAPVVAVLDPLAAAGKKVYEGESCDACHGEQDRNRCGAKAGGRDGAKIGRRIGEAAKKPTQQMLEGGMQPVDVSDEDLKALVAYIKSLKNRNSGRHAHYAFHPARIMIGERRCIVRPLLRGAVNVTVSDSPGRTNLVFART